jgi:hypothetical protein
MARHWFVTDAAAGIDRVLVTASAHPGEDRS